MFPKIIVPNSTNRRHRLRLTSKMSERLHTAPMPEGEYFDGRRFTGLSTLLGVIAVMSLALCLVGAFVNPHQFSYSWLFAFVFFFTLCAGCFFWTIVHHATDADWSVVVRRQLENIAVLLGVLALLFIPILLLRRHLYSWMDIPPGHEATLDSKRAYLNFHWFLIRAIIFFAFWIVASLLLRRFSARQDKDGNPLFTIWMRRVSFISLPLFALCLTFGAFDWMMSLNYRWYFNHVRGVHLCRNGWQLDGVAGAGDHRFATSRLPEGRRHARALSHHGEMDARVLRLLGLHRLWSVHAHLVCEYPGGDPIFPHAKYAIVVGTQHASGDRPVLCTVWNFAIALD